MPIYSYRHPKTGQTIEVIQGMKEVHEYIDSDGVKWDREFSVPTMSVDANVDAFNDKAFVEATRNKKGSMGDMLDAAKELSEKRAALAGGVDPVKEKFYKDYSKARKGGKHPAEMKERGIDNKHIKVTFDD